MKTIKESVAYAKAKSANKPRHMSVGGLNHMLLSLVGKGAGRVQGDIIDAKAKAAKLAATRDALGLRKEQVIALGDGANDLAMMAEAGVSIAFHAKPVVRDKATHAFNYAGLDGLPALYG